jgi:hypothetical protein
MSTLTKAICRYVNANENNIFDIYRVIAKVMTVCVATLAEASTGAPPGVRYLHFACIGVPRRFMNSRDRLF